MLYRIFFFQNRFPEHDSEFPAHKWFPQSSDFKPIEHLWDVQQQEIPIMDMQQAIVQQLRDDVMWKWTKISD